MEIWCTFKKGRGRKCCLCWGGKKMSGKSRPKKRIKNRSYQQKLSLMRLSTTWDKSMATRRKSANFGQKSPKTSVKSKKLGSDLAKKYIPMHRSVRSGRMSTTPAVSTAMSLPCDTATPCRSINVKSTENYRRIVGELTENYHISLS